MVEPAASVIVVTHNSGQWLGEFFRSLQAAAQMAGMQDRVQVVVADSGSTDEVLAETRAIAGEARVIACGNVGYGAAVNRAMGECGGAWVMVCNPDLSFPEDFFEKARAVMDGSEQSCVVPRLLNEDKSVQPSVGEFPTVRGIVADQFRARDRRKYVWPQPERAGQVDWAMGACVLVRRDTFQKAGGFDEKFFLYVEEVDFMRRLGGVWFEPALEVVHRSPHSSRESNRQVLKWSARGLLRYFAKWGSWGQLMGYRLLALCSRRLSMEEALASRRAILEKATGP
jgi:GT2 family glycosyltransferase